MKKIHTHRDRLADFLEKGRLTKDDLIYWIKKNEKLILNTSRISLREFFVRYSRIYIYTMALIK